MPSMHSLCCLYLSILFFTINPLVRADGLTTDKTNIITVGNFSQADIGLSLPPGWEPLTFSNIEKHTKYELVKQNTEVIVKAVSMGGASGLFHKISIDPKTHPLLRWRWKVENIISKGDVTSKAGDDYPARIYVTFEYDAEKLSFGESFQYELYYLFHGVYPPLATINYIWDNKSPLNTIVPNAYTDRVKMIVVESGEEHIMQWIEMKRNIYQDYKKAFGEEPGLITSVAIMTDTDNTGEKATAYYGDIQFSAIEFSK